MQTVVGGLIQEYFPFHSEDDPRYDDLALIVNEEGKLMRMPPSRAVFDEDGHVQDVIAGPFFICYAPVESETFLSLPDDLAEEMWRKFDKPEMIYPQMRASRLSDISRKKTPESRNGKTGYCGQNGRHRGRRSVATV